MLDFLLPLSIPATLITGYYLFKNPFSYRLEIAFSVSYYVFATRLHQFVKEYPSSQEYTFLKVVEVFVHIVMDVAPTLVLLSFAINIWKLIIQHSTYKKPAFYLLGPTLISFVLLSPFLGRLVSGSNTLKIIHHLANLLASYLVMLANAYCFSNWIYLFQLSKTPQKTVDYYIVLGADLVNNNVTPILARRIDEAITHYQMNPSSKLIMSGGKGDHDRLSESEAMKNYAIEQGVPETDIILENQATDTIDNVIFSKKLMEKEAHFALVTSDYHIFRATLIAKEDGSNCLSYHATSSFYQRLCGLAREYVSYFYMRLYHHITIMLAIIVIYLVYNFLS